MTRKADQQQAEKAQGGPCVDKSWLGNMGGRTSLALGVSGCIPREVSLRKSLRAQIKEIGVN